MPPQQQQAQRTLRDLIAKYRKLSDTERKTLSEANVVAQFIQPLLDALGWPTGDPARFKYELHTHGGRPDITLLPDAGGTLFVEAKRFGVVQELAEARKTLAGTITPGQLALPGMATDRTAEEQQAINYAFTNGGTWAILTNFEKLRLFNARRDWLVLSFERPEAYLDEFDLLWQIAYPSILDGDLERLSNQRHREDVDTEYLHFINGWRERLAQDIVAHPQRNPWAFNSDGVIRVGLLRTVVQRLLDRLVVVRFAEDHSVIPAGTLQQIYDLARNNPYTFPLYQSFQQLYRRFDEFHNSALFAPHTADQAVLSDRVLGGLVSKLYEARYRALSADIMGNTYEQYLGKTLVRVGGSVVTADNLETRKKQGSYYTPQVIVRYIVDNALGRFLYATANGRPDGERLPDETPKRASDIASLRLIDPACGSGSFLIYAYQLLADFYRREQRRIEREWSERINELSAEGLTPIELQMQTAGYKTELDRLKNYPRLILERHLYGVDLDPQAAEIATVNLIMRAMADQPRDQRRLPLILNQNVKVGNSLVGSLLNLGAEDERYGDEETGVAAATLAALRQLRLDLIGEGGDHDALLHQIEELARGANHALNAELTPFFDELPGGVRAQRPFHWGIEFPEVFFNEAGHHRGEAAGFDIVVGNPPWEIVKPDEKEFYSQFDPRIESKMTQRQVKVRVKELNAGDSSIETRWGRQKTRVEATANYFKSSNEFVRQGRGDTATHKLFTERGFDLLRRGGKLGFVIPGGIYYDLGTKQLRRMLLNEGHIEYLYNFSNERYFFPEVHHATRFSLLGAEKGVTSDGFFATFRFNPRVAVAPQELAEFLAESDNLFYIRRDVLEKFDPQNLVILHSAEDYQIADLLYAAGLPIGEESDKWNVNFAREFDMSGDAYLFNQGRMGLPLYEGKMIHQFDAYFEPPQYWVEEAAGAERLARKQSAGWHEHYRIAFRAVASSTNERTCISTVLPQDTFTGHSLWVGTTPSPDLMLYFITVFNSFCVDWIARFKVNTNVTLGIVKQLPLPRLIAGDPIFDAIVPRAARLTCTTTAFAELWQQVMGIDWSPEVAAVDPAERAMLRRELDALVAHLYGLSRDEFDHILRTFPLVFPSSPPNEEEGERLRERQLAVFEQMAGEFPFGTAAKQ